MKNYKADFAANTLTVTKDFAIAANDPTTHEFEILAKFKAAYPDMKIVRKTRRAPKQAPKTKGLTYKRMEDYIRLHENADKLIETFNTIKEVAAKQKNPYDFTKQWFDKQFPDYGKLPTIKDGKIVIEDAEEQKEDADPENTTPAAEEEAPSNAIPFGKVENF